MTKSYNFSHVVYTWLFALSISTNRPVIASVTLYDKIVAALKDAFQVRKSKSRNEHEN